MRYGEYHFDPDDAQRFASHINARTRTRGKELELLECPYCHGQGRGNQWKFSISLRDGVFKCQRASCGESGNMIKLSQDFGFSLGNEIYDEPKRQYKTYKVPAEPLKPQPAAIQYLEKRGISKQTAERYQITTKKGADNILAFPFIYGGEISLIKYRKTDFDPEKDANKEWSEKGGKPILFGMNVCNLENKTIICTEGQLDSLSVAEAGFENSVSVPTGAMGWTWYQHCREWLWNFDTVIVFGDHEKGKITLLDGFVRRFKGKVKHVREEDYKDCKDANDILRKYGKEQIKACIENAVTVPVIQTIDLADVEDEDVFKLPKLETGISQLDKLLYGGLPFGGVHIITGKSGCGKSTFASQIIIKAMSDGYICFAYSGELPNYLFKAWMTFQLVGRRNITAYQNRWGDEGFTVSEKNRQAASEWYRGKIRVYDNDKIGSDEKKSILEILNEVIVRYGVKVILLDNLMTAMDLELTHGDEYERQGEFVSRLTRIALEHNVMILLVAHKRKNGYGRNENDEVLGSSKITNLGMLTLTYEKDDEIDPTQRRLKVSKNRLFGRVNTTGFILDFDEKSKRIYGEGDDLDYNYGFNPAEDNDGFMDVEIEEGDLPFS